MWESGYTPTPHTPKTCLPYSGVSSQAVRIAHNINQLNYSNYDLQTNTRKSVFVSV